jgi:hypothetical protein
MGYILHLRTVNKYHQASGRRPYNKEEKKEKRRRPRRPTNLGTTRTEFAKRYNNTKGGKINDTTIESSIPTRGG